MVVLARFTYEIKPGRMGDFMAKLGQAASPSFDSPSMPKAVRLFRCSVPGPDTDRVILHIEYESMEAYGARTDFENNTPEWRALFSVQPDSPEHLLSVELLIELQP